MARTRLDPQLEELARTIGEIIAGRGYSAAEETAFAAGLPRSKTYAVQVTSIPKLVATINPGRQQFIIHNASANDIEVVDGPNGVFGRGLPVKAGVERGLGDYTGEVWLVAGVAGPLDIRIREES